MGNFGSFVAGLNPVSPILPLAHNMDFKAFVNTMENKNIQLAHRAEYKQDLVFAFYGRPAYRLHPDLQHSSLAAVHTVCYLLDSSAVDICRIVPFDTGAMEGGFLKKGFHPEHKKEDFEIGPSIEDAQKIVGGFFQSNKEYMAGTPSNPTIPMSEVEANCYYAMISSQISSEVDDRKSTIEVQSAMPITLNDKNVRAVILPEPCLDDPAVSRFIENELKACPIPYLFCRSKPSEDARVVMQKAYDFYVQEKLV